VIDNHILGLVVFGNGLSTNFFELVNQIDRFGSVDLKVTFAVNFNNNELDDLIEDYCKSRRNANFVRDPNLSRVDIVNSAIRSTDCEMYSCLLADNACISYLVDATRRIRHGHRPLDLLAIPLDQPYRASGLFSLLMGNGIFSGSIFSRRIFDKIGGFNNQLGANGLFWDFWISIIEEDGKVDLMSTTPVLPAQKYTEEDETEVFHRHRTFFTTHIESVIEHSRTKIWRLISANAEKDKEIESYKRTLSDAKVKFNNLSEQYHQLASARIIKGAIALHRYLTSALHSYFALNHKLIDETTRITPDLVKDFIKRTKGYIDNKRTTIIKNRKWPDGLPLVSIVTPFYNQGETIDATVRSVLSQTFTNIEYIIVNDGSDEKNTRQLGSVRLDSHARIISCKENIGKGSPAAARNLGISQAKGKYIICLDSDDMLDPTYVEKCLITLETNPQLGLATCIARTFGASEAIIPFCEYNPHNLLANNMVKTSAMFRKDAWRKVGGFKPDIGYEDWELWINLAENGYFGKLIGEPLFYYREAEHSRYMDDLMRHKTNVEMINSLHPNYHGIINSWIREKSSKLVRINCSDAFVNLSKEDHFVVSRKKNVLIAMAWMPFGGAERLIYNFCNQLKDDLKFHFVTGLKCNNEWEYKFKKISGNIFHIANLFEDKELKLEFLANYIRVHHVSVLHIIHTDFLFDILPSMKARFPQLKIIVTMFNAKVENYFMPSIHLHEFIDVYTSDNHETADHYAEHLPKDKDFKVIPNGIDCHNEFNPNLYDRGKQRKQLGLSHDDLAVFFVGRLSEEKNPEAFVSLADRASDSPDFTNVKFFMIGDGPLGKKIEQEIKTRKLTNVNCLGYRDDITHCLSAADVFILPSLVDGFPVVILEAMSMQVAVIASGIGAIPTVIDDHVDGYVIAPGSVDEMFYDLGQINSDRDQLSSVKKIARRKIRAKYSMQNLKANYSQLYG